MGDLVRARLTVRGRVQGVFYRQSSKEMALSLGLVGWVRNEPDGSVALEAHGQRQSVERLIAWCKKGPPSARVDGVAVEWLNAAGANLPSRFEIVG